jgi:hypothetical protein
MVLGYIYSAITRLFYGDTDSKIDDSANTTENNDLTSSCIIGKSLTPNVMAPLPKNIVLTNVKN